MPVESWAANGEEGGGRKKEGGLVQRCLFFGLRGLRRRRQENGAAMRGRHGEGGGYGLTTKNFPVESTGKEGGGKNRINGEGIGEGTREQGGARR